MLCAVLALFLILLLLFAHFFVLRFLVVDWTVAQNKHFLQFFCNLQAHLETSFTKLTWLVLGEDQAARSHRVEQLTAL